MNPVRVRPSDAVRAAVVASTFQMAVDLMNPPKEKGREPVQKTEVTPQKVELDARSTELDQIRELETRIESLNDREVGELRRLISDYRQRTQGGSKNEVTGVRKEEASAGAKGVNQVLSRVMGQGVADFIAPAGPVEVTQIRESRISIPELNVDDKSLAGKEEAINQAGGLWPQIWTSQPREMIGLIQQLDALQRSAGGGDLTSQATVGILSRNLSTMIKSNLGSNTRSIEASAVENTMQEDVLQAENRLVFQHDVPGAAAQMNEMEKKEVTYRQALGMMDQLRMEAAQLALEGKGNEARAKAAELIGVSSSLPIGPVAQGMKDNLIITIPKTSSELTNGVMNTDRVDLDTALKTVGMMDELAMEAKKQGMDADASSVFMEAMKLRQQHQQTEGRTVPLSQILNEEGQTIITEIGREMQDNASKAA